MLYEVITAKEVFEIMVETGDAPDKIVEERGLKQVTDTGAIEAVVDQVIAANPDKVAEVKAGKEKLLGWFVGQVMKASQGKANPGILNEMLKKNRITSYNVCYTKLLRWMWGSRRRARPWSLRRLRIRRWRRERESQRGLPGASRSNVPDDG